MHPAPLALVLALASWQVSAQPAPQTRTDPLPHTDIPKREPPHVRAALDCIAHAISDDSVALQDALGDRWSDAFAAAGEVCRGQLTRMVAEHDRLYGNGAGEAFVKGAFLSDLPRALMLRLTPELERRAAE